MEKFKPPDSTYFRSVPCAATLFFFALLAGDLAFLGLHVFNHFFISPGNLLLDIEQDNGYAEVYQYLKFFWIILMLSQLAWARRATLSAMGAAVCLSIV